MAEHDDEREIICAAQRGDTTSFEVLIAHYQRMIYALTYRMTGSVTDAEDLAQEVFIQAYRRLESFRGDAKFSSWLYRIGINTCLNWQKSRHRREQLYGQFAEDRTMAGNPSGELIARVQAALLKLDPKQRAAIVLTVYEDMNHAEAARVLGCSEATVSWRVFVARKKLKQWLQSSD